MTPMQEIACAALKRDVFVYVQERREKKRSWDRIATDIAVDTRGKVRLSGETLRGWMQR